MQKDLLRGTPYYALALLTTVVVLAVRYALQPVLGGTSPFLAFVIAVAASAYLGGLGPGLLATLLSAGAGTHFFVRSPGGFGVPELTNFALFLVVGVAISYL